MRLGHDASARISPVSSLILRPFVTDLRRARRFAAERCKKCLTRSLAIFGIVMISLGLLLLPQVSEARTRSGNGWSPGRSSDEIAGRLGKKKAVSPKSSGRATRRKSSCTRTRSCRGSSRTSGRTSSDEAMTTARLPAPIINISPSVSGLVGITTRASAVLPASVEFHLEIDGISTKLLARPRIITWHLGNGKSMTSLLNLSSGSDGTAWAEAILIEFESAGVHFIEAVASWDVHWTSTDGDQGTVDGRESTSVIQYPVSERRSVLTKRH